MPPFKPKLRHLLALLYLAATSAMAGNAVIGFVKTVDTNASVVIAGQAVAAHPVTVMDSFSNFAIQAGLHYF